METFSLGLMLAGVGFLAVGYLLVIVGVFKQSVIHGILAFFIPLIALIYVLSHFGRYKKQFFLMCAGGSLIIAGTGASLYNDAGKTGVEPVVLELADLEKAAPENLHVKIGKHVGLYSQTFYFENETSSPESLKVDKAFYPIFELQKFIELQRHVESEEGGQYTTTNLIFVQYQNRPDIKALPEDDIVDSLQGILDIAPLARERDFVKANYSDVKYQNLYILKEGQKPGKPGSGLGMLGTGLALFALFAFLFVQAVVKK